MTCHARALVAAVALTVAVGCGPSADEEILARSWSGYRSRFITEEGRVVRPEHGHDTVSEGQAYALLRSAWMDDRATFDRVWRWTNAHLGREGRPGPSLLAWRWTAESGVADWNVAADADADVALALLVAAARWPTAAPEYRSTATAMLTDLLEHLAANDERGATVFLPGAWADQRSEGGGLVLNPSYLAPASFRAFHRATGDARWLALVDGAYGVLEATCEGRGSTLAPDWIRWWSRDRWEVERHDNGSSSGWDAVRVPWRVGTDWQWFHEPRARAYLDRCVKPVALRRMESGLGVPVEMDERAASGTEAAPEHPLANALFSFAFDRPAERDALLARVLPRLVWHGRDLFIGEPDRYYVNSLGYLPFLARAGRFAAP